MTTKQRSLAEMLQEEFKSKDIEWRVGRSGKTENGLVWAKVFAYVTARAGQDRLDRVMGPGGWQVKYDHATKGVMCHLSLKIGTEWVTKCDGAEETEMEAFKGGISSAFKRTASVWGIGRYLYDLEEGFAKIVPRGTVGSTHGKAKLSNGAYEDFFWLPPELPLWALPESERPIIKSNPMDITNKASILAIKESENKSEFDKYDGRI